MSKHRRQRGAASAASTASTASAAPPAGADQEAVAARPPAKTGWRRFPIWAWVLIFVIPLALSEFMFYQAGRALNMVLFPIVWAGFWAALWFRSTARAGQ